MNTKFKMSIEEMLDFNDACDMACGQSPGYRSDLAVPDRDICLKKITAKQLVKHWKRCRILWRNGFYECLSPDAAYVFEEYEEYKLLRASK